jgi:hypothetical protein
MGTRCYVGLEKSNRTVEYIEIDFDGYFSNMVPFLKNKTQEEVKKMIDEGEKKYERSIYALLSPEHRINYIYIFTKENNWICHQSTPYIDMNELKY